MKEINLEEHKAMDKTLYGHKKGNMNNQLKHDLRVIRQWASTESKDLAYLEANNRAIKRKVNQIICYLECEEPMPQTGYKG